jgi:hypothetical protein
MRKNVSLLLVFLFTAVVTIAQNPPASPRVSAEGKDIKVEYGQPSKKGRVLFGPEGSDALEKYGKLWRIGANQGTEITFKKDGKFGGESVKAGSYTLFAIPTETDWTIILNSVIGQRGASEYEKNKEKDVLRITVPKKTHKNVEEKLVFRVEKSSLDFQWDNVGFSVPTKF